jgi:hypothetical protein
MFEELTENKNLMFPVDQFGNFRQIFQCPFAQGFIQRRFCWRKFDAQFNFGARWQFVEHLGFGPPQQKRLNQVFQSLTRFAALVALELRDRNRIGDFLHLSKFDLRRCKLGDVETMRSLGTSRQQLSVRQGSHGSFKCLPVC